VGYGFECSAQVSDRVSPGNELSRSVVDNKVQQLQVQGCSPVMSVLNSRAISLDRPTYSRKQLFEGLCCRSPAAEFLGDFNLAI
jgi:hypothetical protein